MTVPACSACNGGFSADEMRVAAVVCTVSFTQDDRQAVAPGGRVYLALQSDRGLQEFVGSRLNADGIFFADQVVHQTLARIMAKTAAGLLFHEFGRLVPLDLVRIIAMEHAKNVHPSALVEQHRRDHEGWAEVTPSCRELERQVLALYGEVPPHMPDWRVYGIRSRVFRVPVYPPVQQQVAHRDETARCANRPRGVPLAGESRPAPKGASAEVSTAGIPEKTLIFD
jgi:hypothetical protein